MSIYYSIPSINCIVPRDPWWHIIVSAHRKCRHRLHYFYFYFYFRFDCSVERTAAFLTAETANACNIQWNEAAMATIRHKMQQENIVIDLL